MWQQLMGRWILVAAIVCLSLARAAVAQDPQLLVGARTVGAPSVFVWADTAEGTSIDDDAAAAIAKLYTDTDWGFFDNNNLVIGKNAQIVEGIPVMLFVGNDDQTFFLIHRRVGNASIDGKVVRDAASKDGFAEFHVTAPSADGKVIRTAFIQVGLKFTK